MTIAPCALSWASRVPLGPTLPSPPISLFLSTLAACGDAGSKTAVQQNTGAHGDDHTELPQCAVFDTEWVL